MVLQRLNDTQKYGFIRIGGLMKSIHRVFLFSALFASGAFAQPSVSLIQNNYSYVLPGMPNYGIAQGAIFDIFGKGLAPAPSTLQNVPLPVVLNGTSVNISVNGVTTRAILYFVSQTQIAAILPSTTPAGTGQLTVSVGVDTSPAVAIKVVQSAFGMLTLNAGGSGPAAAFDVKSNYLGFTNAANPGEVIILWGSGLGPAAGNETLTQVPVNLIDIPIEVDIGGIPATVAYHGRSIYPGLDQINVVVPAVTPGCYVSVAVRSGNIMSNFATIPVAASGRICSEPVLSQSASQMQSLASKAAFNLGTIQFGETVSSVYTDTTNIGFSRLTGAQFAASQPGSVASLGSCAVYNISQGTVNNPVQAVALDAGAAINVQGPVLSTSIPFTNGAYNASTEYRSSALTSGTYTFTGSGGRDIGSFKAQLAIAGSNGGFTWSTSDNKAAATRSQGVTVTWTGNALNSATSFVQISGTSLTILSGSTVGAVFYCSAPASAGQFTVPASVLLALPATPAGDLASRSSLTAGQFLFPQTFTGDNIDVGLINSFVSSSSQFNYQ
jgi:uncharacterized protein (TIGR03437 family)